MKTKNLHNFPIQPPPPNIFHETLENITEGQGREGVSRREEGRMTLPESKYYKAIVIKTVWHSAEINK